MQIIVVAQHSDLIEMTEILKTTPQRVQWNSLNLIETCIKMQAFKRIVIYFIGSIKRRRIAKFSRMLFKISQAAGCNLLRADLIAIGQTLRNHKTVFEIDL